MADEKVKKEKVKKEAKPKTTTTVSLIKDVAVSEHADRAAVVAEVLVLAKKKGVDTNIKGNKIDAAKITSLLSAICRDIKNGKSGWWSTFEVIEETDEAKGKKFIMRPKATF